MFLFWFFLASSVAASCEVLCKTSTNKMYREKKFLLAELNAAGLNCSLYIKRGLARALQE